MKRDRKVTVKYYKQLYNCCLEGEGTYKGNRQLSLFSLTQKEAEDFAEQIGKVIRKNEHRRTDLDENTNTGA